MTCRGAEAPWTPFVGRVHWSECPQSVASKRPTTIDEGRLFAIACPEADRPASANNGPGATGSEGQLWAGNGHLAARQG